jgi:ankyrin repeat protein
VVQVASLNGHLDIVEVLTEKGADVNAEDQHGDSVLQVASYSSP